MIIEVKVIEIIKEDACANGSNSAGMGSVTAAQPSTNAGSTIGSSFTSGGGTTGSGDVSGGWFNNNAYQKSPAGVKKKKRKGKSGKSEVFSQKQNWTHGGDGTPKRQKMQSFNDFTKVTHLTNEGF